MKLKLEVWYRGQWIEVSEDQYLSAINNGKEGRGMKEGIEIGRNYGAFKDKTPERDDIAEMPHGDPYNRR
jgi:hypothetical protein